MSRDGAVVAQRIVATTSQLIGNSPLVAGSNPAAEISFVVFINPEKKRVQRLKNPFKQTCR